MRHGENVGGAPPDNEITARSGVEGTISVRYHLIMHVRYVAVLVSQIARDHLMRTKEPFLPKKSRLALIPGVIAHGILLALKYPE